MLLIEHYSYLSFLKNDINLNTLYPFFLLTRLTKHHPHLVTTLHQTIQINATFEAHWVATTAFFGLMLATNGLMLDQFVKGLHKSGSLKATVINSATSFLATVC